MQPHWINLLYNLNPTLQVSEEDNPEFEKLCKLLDKIKFKNQKASFTEPVDVEQFLPNEEDDRTFWTYEGSLTTPPLLESVTWILFKRPIKVSEEQVLEILEIGCGTAVQCCPCNQEVACLTLSLVWHYFLLCRLV